jgi:hypothetical protein
MLNTFKQSYPKIKLSICYNHYKQTHLNTITTMKELPIEFEPIPAIVPTEQPPAPKRMYRETPRWIVAKSRTDNKMLCWQNEAVEQHYHEIIARVKERILQHGGDTIFEQDHKNDKDSYTGMHSFVSSTFFWRLDCELAYNYKVYFAFHNCPYEDTIRQMMAGYPLDRTTQEHRFPNGFEAFYNRVLEVQDPIHITFIKA